MKQMNSKQFVEESSVNNDFPGMADEIFLK